MKVSWDDSSAQYMESHKIHVPNHQPDINIKLILLKLLGED
jgi:hypothetical protein